MIEQKRKEITLERVKCIAREFLSRGDSCDGICQELGTKLKTFARALSSKGYNDCSIISCDVIHLFQLEKVDEIPDAQINLPQDFYLLY